MRILNQVAYAASIPVRDFPPLRLIADVGGLSLFAGPIIAREVLTAPRPLRYYLWRASFSCFLFILLWTAWQSIIGWQDVRELGVMARFGGILYCDVRDAPVDAHALLRAAVHRGRDLLRERSPHLHAALDDRSLSDLEIVLGKLVAGLLNILMILAASIGLVSLCALFGGISFGQVVNLFAVTAASGVAGGALGLLIALWRDRTFQSISLTILMVVFSVTGVEVFAIFFPTLDVHGRAAGAGPQSLPRDAGGALSRQCSSLRRWCERRAWSTSGHD